MNIQDEIDKIKCDISNIRSIIAKQKCNYKQQYLELEKLENKLQQLQQNHKD